ncbi:MAG: lipoprotein-releasing ABC transporter permease subunit [Gammaproteobacteria bacterium]|nr:lipoprotein-releasing ABC transporter permease subunit [Gammaproteobacteria bacterium]MDH3466617.1 lipoprotein-releasing ABC transporter permease subunit [Gammaproteobacteria bacterium]
MIQPLELFIGLRYTRAKRRNHFISFISATSMLGIVLGVWALITVLSIMNGFEGELRDRILTVASHVTVSGEDGWLNDWQRVARQVEQHSQVTASAPFILGQGLVTNRGDVSGALIRGVLPEREKHVSAIYEHMEQGEFETLEAGAFRIVLGDDLARRLGVAMGDKVTVVAPRGQVTPAGMLPRLKRFTVGAVFNLKMYEYDSSLALIHIDDAETLFRSDGQVSGVRLKLDDVFEAPMVNRQLTEILRFSVVRDWTQEHANFFRALQIEKRVMFIILFLIVAVAAFNIVSTLVMVVTDKESDIAILRTLGLSPGSIMQVFIVQGTIIGIIGILLGGVLGVITAINVETLIPAIENLLGTKFFPDEVYIISDFPAEMHWSDVVKITLASFVMSIIATIYPAWRASRTQPADALRYE